MLWMRIGGKCGVAMMECGMCSCICSSLAVVHKFNRVTCYWLVKMETLSVYDFLLSGETFSDLVNV